MIGDAGFLDLPVMEVDGLKEVPEAVVASRVQLGWVHLQHTCAEHEQLRLMLQVIHATVKPLEG